MSENTILVIDDSATIRKLVDTHLSPAGYRVVLAANAELGIQFANEILPDLILLDHQLPGTTGFDVCQQLVQTPALRHIPVVVSSTLRKKAYAEYIDLDNVVDMLPKPYTEELLLTTVANALQTAAMVVASQSHGTAVPEVMQQSEDTAISGTFDCFGLREVMDFLNNGRKAGVLEIETNRLRIRFHLNDGRIQGVYASGLDATQIESIIHRMPKSLVSLAPVLKMTLAGRSCAELDGFVQLLDQKVLDPRLMTKLLRYQAAMLVRLAFTSELNAFRFDTSISDHSLHRNLPLEISLLALLLEAALHGDRLDDAADDASQYARRAIRGQNLDRAGLTARHMTILNLLAEPRDPQSLAETLGWDIDEVRRVLSGFVMAELVQQQDASATGQFVILEPNPQAAQHLRSSLQASDNRYNGKVVRDQLGLQLILKRCTPHTIVFAGDDDAACALMKKLIASSSRKAASVRWVAISSGDQAGDHPDWQQRIGFVPDAVIARPCTAELLFRTMDRIHGHSTASQSDNTAATATTVALAAGSAMPSGVDGSIAGARS